MENPWSRFSTLDDVPALRKANSKPSYPISKLLLSQPTLDMLQLHLDTVGADVRRFDHSVKEQYSAFTLLNDLGVHIPDEIPRDVRSKYSIRFTDNKLVHGKKTKQAYTRCTRIYQCLCGTDHSANSNPTKQREIGWTNVGCISWIKLVTTHHGNERKLLCIDEILGVFDHTAACDAEAEMTRNPRIALHSDIRNYALELLTLHVPPVQLQQRCRDFAKQKFGDAAGDNHNRYILSDHETSSLYRSHFTSLGISQRSAAQENLDKWFRPVDPHPPYPILTESCLHYQPCGDGDNDRFAIIISTPEQRDMAWRHAHKKLLLLDGTFGINSARSLLFIGMAVNEDNRGIPIVFFHFTARKKTVAAHADYDTKILKELLQKWKAVMGQNDAGESFDIKIIITDNDTRERNALSEVFPGALLLLCRFHTMQAWRNALNRKLRVVPRGEAREGLRRQLASFLTQLLKDVTRFEDAVNIYNQLLARYQSLNRRRDRTAKLQAQGALGFLAYFQNYLRLQDFWFAWSPAGPIEAAKRLAVKIDKIPRTTNHLESFNGRIKRRFFAAYQHSGRLPRIDVWVLMLVVKVIPIFFEELHARDAKANYLLQMRLRKTSPQQNRPQDPDSASDDSSLANQSLIPSDHEIAAAESIDEWSTEDWIADLCLSEDPDEVTADAPDTEGKEESDSSDRISELVVLDNGDCLPALELNSVTVAVSNVQEIGDTMSDIEWQEVAAEGEDIVQHIRALAIESNDSDQSTSSTPPSVIPIVGGSPLTPPPSTSQPAAPSPKLDSDSELNHLDALVNKRVVAMQSILAIEDTMVQAIRHAMSLYSDHTTLTRHISPSIKEQLSGHYQPEPIKATRNNLNTLNENKENIPPSTSDQPSPPKRLRALPAFEGQRKEVRKRSYGIR